MKVLIAIDSFKNSMSSKEANEIVYNAINNKDVTVEMVAISDGGEGLVSALTNNIINTKVVGPTGQMVDSFYGLIDKKTAVIEMAAASGIEFLSDDEVDANATTSFGVGELILKALDLNVTKIIIGLGGSATNDLGIGMLIALGAKFYNINHQQIKGYGYELKSIEKVDFSNIDKRLNNVEVIIAADVNNPLYGKKGATRIYGKQKGLKYLDRKQYDANFKRISKLIVNETKKDYRYYPGAGAAGGLGYSLLTFTNSKLVSGFELLEKEVQIASKMDGLDLLITGEGKIDNQTLNGKAPYRIAKLAKEINPDVTVIAFCGLMGKTNKLKIFDQIVNINENDNDQANWIKNGKRNLSLSSKVINSKINGRGNNNV